jgi:hypothetical protein
MSKDRNLIKKIQTLTGLAYEVTDQIKRNPEGIPQSAKLLMTKVHSFKLGDPGIDHLLDALKKSSLMIATLSAYWILDYTRGNALGCQRHADSLESLIEELRPVVESMRSSATTAQAQADSDKAVKH